MTENELKQYRSDMYISDLRSRLAMAHNQLSYMTRVGLDRSESSDLANYRCNSKLNLDSDYDDIQLRLVQMYEDINNEILERLSEDKQFDNPYNSEEPINYVDDQESN
jgi:hypothetical protein